MELKDLQATQQDLIDVPLLFAENGEATDGFKVVGAESDEYQEADRAYRVQNIRRAALRTVDATTTAGAAEVASLMDKREMAILNACVKQIYGFTIEGVPAVLSEATLLTIFSARPYWRGKVLTAIESERRFTKASSTG